MLFILGTKSNHLKDGQIEKFVCPKCSELTELDYSVYQRYTHVTMIPLFPVDKEVVTACSSCGEIIEYGDLPTDAKLEVDALKKDKSNPAPFWMYSGVIILSGFLIFGMYSFLKSNDSSVMYLKNPQRGDVLNFKLSNGYYTTVLVERVTNDSVFGILNDYNASLPYDISDIDVAENYTDSDIAYSKKELVTLYDNDEIYSVTRK
jgi:predicted RNA-binding Zn-ribbon protein involved in translation (DUF1610 family)